MGTFHDDGNGSFHYLNYHAIHGNLNRTPVGNGIIDLAAAHAIIMVQREALAAEARASSAENEATLRAPEIEKLKYGVRHEGTSADP